ncbi:MAG TPA: LysR substrate-binding domain-containing protein, partial [Burkholderiaceae bacterium]|nr:LysR substrate-binding domain-containing protein [Burkholderiaceae bacterium]
MAALWPRAGPSAWIHRRSSGYRMTEFGQAMLLHAQAVERAMLAFQQAVSAAGDEASGVVRVSCPEPVVQRLTQAGLLERFHERHPGLRVVFVVSDRYVDLMSGEADVALRSGDTDDGELIGRKIADSHWAVYGSAS